MPMTFDQPNCISIIPFASSNVHFEVSIHVSGGLTRLPPPTNVVVVENHRRSV